MIHAYDSLYLNDARKKLAVMLDFAVNDLKYNIKDFYNLFLYSQYRIKIENGDYNFIAGKSGIELAYDITNKTNIKPKHRMDRTEEYWAGYALSYYEWYTSLSFIKINSFISIEEIISMYPKYHEMDIMQFVDALNEKYNSINTITNLKAKRLEAKISQSELSKISGVPVRTIQQYEQKVKNINSAKVETLISLSNSLSCDIKDIIEYI